VKDELGAYLFDKAIALFGTCVERDIEKATRGKKTDKAAEAAANAVIAKWVIDGKAAKKRFRVPVATR